ncbi:sensor histidine kinase [Methylosinus sp. LW4]|uniref:sensor histidine kinase n=1 Tax=Methylosinus sp. LW4 TaxID=136993 RepID=UPI000361FF1D|nr:HAMP domain-containing sensor histidine kinase [Methylosinus sp. LW4]
MTIGRSLALRVVCYLVPVQFIAFVVAQLSIMGLGVTHLWFVDTSIDDFAVHRVGRLVIDSLFEGADGQIRLAPTEALCAELERSPDLKYAAFDVKKYEALPGSSPELAETLSGAIRVNSTHTHFSLPSALTSAPHGYADAKKTPYGTFQIAVYGEKFQWIDLLYAVADEFRWSSVDIVSTTLLSIGAAWFAVRRGLAPLRSLSQEASRIDLESLDARLSTTDVPSEAAPLVRAVNEALSRLDASATRLRRYFANAAHELRTPLAILRARIEDREDTPTFKSDLLRDAGRLQVVVEQMLVASRLAESQLPLDQIIDLAEAVRQIVSRHVLLALRCERSIEFEASDPSPKVRGNLRAVECVIANIVDNALRAEPIGGTVLVRVGSDAVVEVIDHGEGLSPSDQATAFEPFWRKSDALPGTGLGLAITKELLDKLGGRIWIEETPGGGATFKIAFQPIR